jgi:hypothetical protein
LESGFHFKKNGPFIWLNGPFIGLEMEGPFEENPIKKSLPVRLLQSLPSQVPMLFYAI